MKINKLNVSFAAHEVCEKALHLLRTKVPADVLIKSVTLDGDMVSICGSTSRAGSHSFTISFRLQYDSDGSAIILKLKRATVTNTWWLPGVPDFALVNGILAKSIPDSPGIQYSWGKERLKISLSELLWRFGIHLEGKIVGMTCGSEIGLVIG